jgi:hypothetical protein
VGFVGTLASLTPVSCGLPRNIGQADAACRSGAVSSNAKRDCTANEGFTCAKIAAGPSGGKRMDQREPQSEWRRFEKLGE